MNGNGHPRRGRPPLRFGERSEVVCLRFPQSDFDFLDQFARDRGISKAAVLRDIPDVLMELLADNERLQDELDHVMQHFMRHISTDDKSLTFIRMVMARAQTTSYESAVQLFLDECPTEPHAPVFRRVLEKFRAANLRRPGSVTDEQLWKAIGM